MIMRVKNKNLGLNDAVHSIQCSAGVLAGCGGAILAPAAEQCRYAFAAPSKCASISSSVFPFVSGRNQVAVTK